MRNQQAAEYLLGARPKHCRNDHHDHKHDANHHTHNLRKQAESAAPNQRQSDQAGCNTEDYLAIGGVIE